MEEQEGDRIPEFMQIGSLVRAAGIEVVEAGTITGSTEAGSQMK